MTDHAAAIVIRAPSVSTAAPNPAFTIPSTDFLTGTWHVTHSTLPMWKSNKNVRITYTPVADTPEKLDDLVEYQSVKGDKVKSVHGIDTPNSAFPGSWDWRGKGWLMIASSHWEVLGYGPEEGGWVVTYFAKTLFTPAGIDVYAKGREGLSEDLLKTILDGMKEVDDVGISKLLEGVFSIQHD